MSYKKWMGALLLFAALLVGSTLPARAEVAAGHTAMVTGNLNLRKTKSTKKKNILTTIKKNKVVEVLTLEDGGWAQVTYRDKTGYVKRKYLTDNPNLMQTTAGLRQRSSAKTDNKKNILQVIPKGEVVEAIAKYTNGWYKVSYKGKSGYVSGKYLKATTKKSSTDKELKKTTAPLHLRKSKSLEKKNLLLTIPKGETVTVISEEKGGWTKVKYKKTTGYVKSQFLKAVPKKTVSTEEAEESEDSDESSTETKVMAEALNMRSAKTTKKKNVIDVIPKGTKVTVTNEGGGWYKVKYNGKTGYILGGHFTDDTSRMKKN